MIMTRLSVLDEVAYVRFASVYRQFRDVNQFMSELQTILTKNKIKKLKKQKRSHL
jgi:transcriptional repressor NrdR